jgi:hypothetical protein
MKKLIVLLRENLEGIEEHQKKKILDEATNVELSGQMYHGLLYVLGYGDNVYKTDIERSKQTLDAIKKAGLDQAFKGNRP